MRVENVNEELKNSYTLVEMLIVLLIISVITAIGYSTFQTFYREKEIHYFLDTLQKDLYFTQQKASEDNKKTTLMFDPDTHSYTIRNSPFSVIKKVDFPVHIFVEAVSMPLQVTYNPNGNISVPGTLLIKTKMNSYKLVFQLGKGRFYVSKQ